MKIVVLDGYTENPGDLSWNGLAAFGELVVYDRTTDGLAYERMGDADIVFTNKTMVTEKDIESAPNLKMIGLLATGYDVVDVAAAAKRGIPVCNIPGYGTMSVAQTAISLLLEIVYQVGHHSRTVREGRWITSADYCYWDTPLIELAGKTLGIIGYGSIGQAVGRIAQALGMKLLVNARHPVTELENENCRYVSKEEIFEKSDVISLHCPQFPETVGMINKETIAKMKDGVIIINTARGPLINEQDLADALKSGKVYAAGLDVLCSEPMDKDNPLRELENCFITPHIAWAAKEARIRLMDIAIDIVKNFTEGHPINVVNM